jgi:DNA-directed RNA polymerase subunit RPC12/RpoP
MKCINCGTDNNLKDRTANYGKCIKCGHRFVFEPTSMGTIKITDPMFAKTISDISVNGTLAFTPKQLFYFLDSRFKQKSFNVSGFGCLYLFFSVWATLFFGGFLSFLLGPNSFAIVFYIYNLIWIISLFKKTKSSKLNNRGRKYSARGLQFLGGLVLIGGMIISLFIIKSFPAFVIAVITGMGAIYLGFRQLNQPELPQESLFSENQVADWLNRWQQTNGTIPKLLPQPQPQNQLSAINPDVTAYSFDRLIVCDRAEIAQFLIANNFHFENNCAILSINGYPQSIFQTTMEMLRRNPDLKVYALHDCTSKGLGLIHRLKTSPAWFQNSNVAIIDIGINPRQVLATKKGIFLEISPQSANDAKQLTAEIRQELSPTEIQWLEAGNIVNLESFPPQKLIQVIQRGIANSQIIGSDNDNLMIVSSSDNFIYATESFG